MLLQTAGHGQVGGQGGALSQSLHVLHCIDRALHPLRAQHCGGVGAELVHQVLLTQRPPPVAVKGVAPGQIRAALLRLHLHLAVHLVEAGLVPLGGLHRHFGQELLEGGSAHVGLAVRGDGHFVVQQRRAGVELERVPGLVLRRGEGTVDVLGLRHPQRELPDSTQVKVHLAALQLGSGRQGRVHHPVHPQVGGDSLDGHGLVLQHPPEVAGAAVGHRGGAVILVVNAEAPVQIQDGWVALQTQLGQPGRLQASAGGVAHVEGFGLGGGVGQGSPRGGGGDSQSVAALGGRQSQELSRGSGAAHHPDNTGRVEPNRGRGRREGEENRTVQISTAMLLTAALLLSVVCSHTVQHKRSSKNQILRMEPFHLEYILFMPANWLPSTRQPVFFLIPLFTVGIATD